MASVSVRQDRVQDEVGRVSWVGEGVVLGCERSVRHAVDHHLLHSERPPEHVHVGDGVRSGVEAPVRADVVRAILYRAPGRDSDVRAAYGRLQGGAVDGAELAGTPLVEHDEAVGPPGPGKPPGDASADTNARLSRPA